MRGVGRLQKCMEFVAAGWYAGKYLRLDRTITEPGMFDNYYIDFNIITILFLN